MDKIVTYKYKFLPIFLLASGQWDYLCAFQDAYSRQVVGWQVLATMPEGLLTSASRRVLLVRQPAPGLLVHSDRGGSLAEVPAARCSTTTSTGACACKVAAASISTTRRPRAFGRA